MKGLDIHFFPEIPYQNHNDTSAAKRFRKNKSYYYQTNKIILMTSNSNIYICQTMRDQWYGLMQLE